MRRIHKKHRKEHHHCSDSDHHSDRHSDRHSDHCSDHHSDRHSDRSDHCHSDSSHHSDHRRSDSSHHSDRSSDSCHSDHRKNKKCHQKFKCHQDLSNCLPKCRPKNFLVRQFVQVWTDHLVYTREVVVAFFTGSPELNILLARLFQNQKDIGNLIAKIFGRKAGDLVTRLLTEHIQIAVEVLTAVKSGDQRAQKVAIKKFYQNAEVVGKLFDKLFHTGCLFQAHMKEHITTLLGFSVAFFQGDYVNDIKYLDAYLHAGLDMAFDMGDAAEAIRKH